MLKNEDYPKFKNQSEMFEWIWENRPHTSQLSGLPLLPKGNFKWHWQFLHVLGKGSYPHYKLNPDNILLARPEEHEQQEKYKEFWNIKEKLRQKYYEEYYNKKFI
jgi:hypothetical protein